MVLRFGFAECKTRALLARRAGIGSREALALENLLAERQLTVDELERRLLLGAAETAALVEALEADGFISRREGPGEALSAALVPTPLGRAAFAAAGAVVPDSIDAASRAAIARFVDRATAATEREAERLERLAGEAGC